MLCYRCGSHVPDASETCGTCGQRLDTLGRIPGATSQRKRPGAGDLEGAPYRIGDRVLGRYEVRDTIGAGPLGFAFKCRDREAEVEVALKMINPRFVQSAEEREHFAKVMRLSRKFTTGIARTYDDGVDPQGWLYYTQPFLDGLTLRKIIELRTVKGQFFSLREVEPILAQLVTALEAAQGQGPHADLKPSNIVVQPDVLKVTDYGLARAVPRPPFVQAQKTAGALAYLAPELIDGREVDGRADQYALGVIIGEMLSGQVPVDGQPPLLRQRNVGLDSSVEGFYRRAIASAAEGRYGSLRELLTEFQRLTQQLASGVRPRELTPAGGLAAAEAQSRADHRTTVELPRAKDPVLDRPAPSPEDADEPTPVEAPPDHTIPISAAELAERLAGAAKVNAPSAPRPKSEPPGGKRPRPEAPAAKPRSNPPGKPRSNPPGQPTDPEQPAAGPKTVPLRGPVGVSDRTEPPGPLVPKPQDPPTQAWQTVLSDPSAPLSVPPLFANTRQKSNRHKPMARIAGISVAGIVVGLVLGWWLIASHGPPPAPPAPGPATPTAVPLTPSPSAPATAPASGQPAPGQPGPAVLRP